jgi:hypothetical protein
MGDRTTKLCDYTNVPNAQFIAKPINPLKPLLIPLKLVLAY